VDGAGVSRTSALVTVAELMSSSCCGLAIAWTEESSRMGRINECEEKRILKMNEWTNE
jgi:hypothetical protein